MTKIIDNSKETLQSILLKELQEASEIAIATAYFNITGFGDIEQGLADKPLRLLLGRPPTEQIEWEEEVLHELEEYEDDPHYFKLLQRAIQFFEQPSRQVRIVDGKFFHGKAFLGVHPSFKEVRRGFAIVGSSNFTHGGLTTNRELNMFTTERQTVQELAEWFQQQWSDTASREYKNEFLALLKTYITSWSAYEVAAKALWETYKKDIAEKRPTILKDLYPHQQLTFVDALDKIETYGGVVIADSTGLGKTLTALALAHYYKGQGVRTLLIAPKSILDTTWKTEMEKTDITIINTINSEKLSADPESINHYLDNQKKIGLIIVDEAHYFRHPATNRYNALYRLVKMTNAKLVLMTATPVNTSLMDLYHIMALYLNEDAIYDEYRTTLRDYFIQNQKKWLNNEPVDMDDILRKFVVRHSRQLAKALDREGRIRFPERLLHTIHYDLPIDVEKLYNILDSLNLSFYELSVDKLSTEFKLPNGRPASTYIEQAKNLKNLVKEIHKIGLLKRLESSIHAFKESINRMKTYIEYANRYATENNIFIPPRLKGELFALLDDEEEPEELPKIEDLFSKHIHLLRRCKLSEEEARQFIEKNQEDLKKINEILAMLPKQDPKLEALLTELKTLAKKLTNNNGIIIFTQYVDTASYLFNHLKTIHQQTLLVTGRGGENSSGKRLDEAEAVELFQKNGGIMVSTDVLSAGQNLQNAQHVINYDFPWNPVTLIQRAGRIDRIGSPYDHVYLHNMMPSQGSPDDPHSLEYFLKLLSRLYLRLAMISSTVGLDASTLGEEAIPRDFTEQKRIAAEDRSILAEIEKRIEQFTRDPLDDLARIINEKGLDWVEKLPNGIGALKKDNLNAVFALFTDGQQLHWRMKNLDTGETSTKPSEIVPILLRGDPHSKGERINYDTLVDKLKQLKEELKTELDKKHAIETTIEGMPIHSNKTIREIYDALEKTGEEGIKLAAIFKKHANNPNIVKQLKKALNQGNLLEEAKKLLKNEPQTKTINPTQKRKIKRICWCLITK
ncbi:DNA/RNA helicase [Candidatus Caldarchaeum subterraneum]|uniref:DNA/RNA helicase n=1 Tax=Caldiarchaeum subterraneum TaxID=311458 RepID=E6N612_CALS0|nr:DNA/RNA helicase [Candidatus Caldarchaeum subterraneum]BAJ49438.1 DNA/RNA helicase [Candidatus Caldarchaeum subterraneum]BAJ50608.1 DNA/RNA helicase [Candidatus Caldarchaeum subterraneum]